LSVVSSYLSITVNENEVKMPKKKSANLFENMGKNSFFLPFVQMLFGGL
jgi:hypothetical protein